MSIQIVHCSDLHLDKNFNISNLERARARKEDLNKSFSRVVEFALQNRPDVFVISGDVFDKISPANAAMVYLTQQIKQLHDASIPVFVIGGNHEVPKFGMFPSLAIDVLSSAGLATVFSGSNNVQKRLLQVGSESICVSGRSYYTRFEGANPLKDVSVPLDGDYNVLLIHGSLQGLSVAPSGTVLGDLNPFSAGDIAPGLDYLALGHFHNFFTREHNDCAIVNPGSLEKLSWAERQDEKGFAWVELHDADANVERIPLPSRPMDEQELTFSKDSHYTPNIQDYLIEELSSFSDDALLCKVNLLGQMSQEQYSQLKLNEVIHTCKDKFFQLLINRKDLEVEGYGRIFLERVDNPEDAFRKRLDRRIGESAINANEKDRLELVKKLGLKYLETAR